MADDTALSVTDLVVRSAAREILRSVTVEVGRGRIAAVVGPNGAGKSTLLHAVAGLVAPTAGRIRVLGMPPGTLPNLRARVGFSSDALTAFPGHTVVQHLHMVAALAQVPPSGVERAMGGVGLTAHRRMRVSRLSLGMRRRLSLAVATLSDPDLLLLDEPFNGLDPDGQRWLADELRTRAHRGTGILLSSHGLAALDSLVDDLVVLERGRVVTSGPLRELTRTIGDRVRVAASRPDDLRALLGDLGVTEISDQEGALVVSGVGIEDLAAAAMARGIIITTLLAITPTLADVVDRQITPEESTPDALFEEREQ